MTLSDGTRMAVKPGAVEVLVDGAWTYAMRFQNGTGIFNVAGWMWVPSDPRRKAAAAIANKLGAEIRNDDWELYEW